MDRFFWGVWWFFVCAMALAFAGETIDVGSRLELFVDHTLIERLDGVSLRPHAPQPAGSVLFFDKPWEGRYCGYVTVILDAGVYRMYYRGLPEAGKDGSETERTCYAESADGVYWTKPKLGLFEVNGGRENNIILDHMAPFSHNFAPFLDTRAGVPAAERYKALAGTSQTGLVGFVSADGLRWTKLREEPLIREGAFDSQNVAFWSESEGLYVCYFRTWSEGSFGGFRSVSRATSPDFLSWSEPVEMSYGDTPREHLYTNQTHPYFRAPHIYIATAARFMPGRRVLTPEQFEAIGGEARYSGDCSDTVLLTSRGGIRYHRTFMEGFVRPGLGAGNWSSRTNYPACGVVPVGPGEMAMYLQRNYGQATHHLERLTLRTDGFASAYAPYTGGELLTKPLRFRGKQFVLNYATSAAGSVWIELQDEMGQAIGGFTLGEADEIIGDEIERVVTWGGAADLSPLVNQPIRLRLVLKDADVYSFRFQ